MPWDRRKYPPNWEAIVARVAERSGGRCECRERLWLSPHCLAPRAKTSAQGSLFEDQELAIAAPLRTLRALLEGGSR